MFIHFAFGSLAKECKIKEQTQNVIELILKEKRIKASECPEFIPVFPASNKGVRLNLGDPEVKSDRLIVMKLRGISTDDSIAYLPVPVKMLHPMWSKRSLKQ